MGCGIVEAEKEKEIVAEDKPESAREEAPQIKINVDAKPTTKQPKTKKNNIFATYNQVLAEYNL